jgi:hypothetical protein
LTISGGFTPLDSDNCERIRSADFSVLGTSAHGAILKKKIVVPEKYSPNNHA